MRATEWVTYLRSWLPPRFHWRTPKGSQLSAACLRSRCFWHNCGSQRNSRNKRKQERKQTSVKNTEENFWNAFYTTASKTITTHHMDISRKGRSDGTKTFWSSNSYCEQHSLLHTASACLLRLSKIHGKQKRKNKHIDRTFSARWLTFIHSWAVALGASPRHVQRRGQSKEIIEKAEPADWPQTNQTQTETASKTAAPTYSISSKLSPVQ